MLGSTRRGVSLWIGAGAAILAVGLTGCGGSKKSSDRELAAAAGVTSATTGGSTSGSTTGGGSTGGGTIGGGGTGGGTIGGGGSTGGGSTGGGSTGGGSTGGGSTGGGSTGGGSTGGGTSSGSTPPAGVTDDHANNGANASTLTTGTPRNGVIEYAGDHDWFKIDLSQGVDYTFFTNNLGANMDTVLRLISPTGTQLAENDDEATGTPTSRITHTPAASGVHFVVVLHKSAQAATGTYSVGAILGSGSGGGSTTPDDHGDTIAAASALTIGTPLAGGMQSAGDVDYFKVDLQAGTAYEFLTQNLGNAMDTRLYLVDANGTDIGDNDDVDFGDVSSRVAAAGFNLARGQTGSGWTPPAAGSYYLIVEDYYAAAGGTYEIVANVVTGGGSGGGTTTPPADDHGNDAANATALAMGAAVAGTIETTGDNDWFKVDLVAGATYEFKTQNLANSMDSRLYLIDTDGTTQLAYNDDVVVGDRSSRIASAGTLSSGNTGSGFTAPATGTYYLRANEYFSSASGGTYEVTAIQLSGAPTTNPPPSTSVATLNAVLWDDVDGSYNASAGDTLTLTFSEAVSIILAATSPPPTTYADTDFALPVAGDTFGTNAAWTIAATNSAQIVITLGASPVLHLSGTFDATKVTAGAASGIEIKASTTIETASSALQVQTGQKVDIASNVNPGFVASASMVEPRGGFAATVMNDGRILVTGGRKTSNTFAFANEVYDPTTNAWTEVTTNYMAFGFNGQNYRIGRHSHTQTLLADGRVLIAGGFGYESATAGTSAPQAVVEELVSAFVFDPATDSFDVAGQLNIARESHYATLLPNGQVLITGGYNSAVNNGAGGTLPAAELWDPTTSTFTMISQTGDDMVYPREAGSAHVVNGNVLHVGGMLYGATVSNPTVTLYMAPGSEIFDVATGTSTAGPALGQNRRWFAGADLASGEVLVIGGDTGSAATATVEKYDPTANTFSAVGNLAAARARHGAAITGNTVVVAGGVSIDYTAGAVTYVATGEVYDVAANVTETYQLVHGRNSHRVVALKDGRVMVIGGWENGLTTTTGSDGTAVPACEVFVRP